MIWLAVLLAAALALALPSAWAEEAEELSALPEDAPVEEQAEEPAPETPEDAVPSPEEQEDQPHAGHHLALLLEEEAQALPLDEEGHALARVYDLYCEDCGQVVARTDQTEEALEPHVYPEDGWLTLRPATCAEPGAEYNFCAVCGWETERETPLEEHTWRVVSVEQPTCTDAGLLVLSCTVCGAEDRLESPALGHVYDWVNTGAGTREYRCLVCGDVQDTQAAGKSEIWYNRTITSFGPTTRELIGGTVWNRVTPLDVSEEGVYTYPLIASNQFSVGTATVTIEDGCQTVSYQLNSDGIKVHSESLVIYPSLNSLRTGVDAQAFDFDVPIGLEENFGGDTRLIMGITLKVDYDTTAPGVQQFHSNDEQITLMNGLID